jgi:hypothetical protein
MDSRAIPVFLAGPLPVLHTFRLDRQNLEVELDVALLIGGQPNILASTCFALDETWQRIRVALESGEARLGVAGVYHPMNGTDADVASDHIRFPSAYVGLECANGERLVLSHIRGLDLDQNAESYAREVIDSILQGYAPDELGVIVED